MLPQLPGSDCVLGLDSGTLTGFAVLAAAGDVLAMGALDFTKSPRYVRWTAMRHALGLLLDQYTPALTVIEGYGFGNQFSLATLVEFGTMLRLVLLDRKLPFIEIPPPTLKAFVGKGSAKKDEVRLQVFQQWGIEHPSNDAVDAYLSAQVARAILGYAKRTERQSALLKRSQAGPYLVAAA